MNGIEWLQERGFKVVESAAMPPRTILIGHPEHGAVIFEVQPLTRRRRLLAWLARKVLRR